MSLFFILELEALEVEAYIGCYSEEQTKKQKINISWKIYFDKEPKACNTDNLSDSICYNVISSKIKEMTLSKHWNLIEHLAKNIYELIKLEIKNSGCEAKILVTIDKFPNIEGLKGKTSFLYGDKTM